MDRKKPVARIRDPRRRLKILLLANHLNPGGVSAYCLLLGRGLAERGHEVAIASGGGAWEKRARDAGIELIRAPLDTSSELNPKLWGAVRILDRRLRERPADIVHDQTRVTQVVSAFLARRRPFRRVSTCHGTFRRRFFRRLWPLWGETVIAVSGAVGRHLREDWKLDPSRVAVVPHGIPMPKLDANGEGDGLSRRMRQGWATSPDGILIGALGRLSPVKGYSVLLRAIASLKKENIPAHLVLVGDGPEGRALKELARNLGIGDRARFVPPLDDTRGFFAAVDIFCAPSIEEGFGLAILEAMAHAKPVVASRVGGIPGLVEDGTTGLLVPSGEAQALAEALGRLAHDTALRRTLGAASRRRAEERFSARRMIEDTEAVYRRLVRA